MDNCLFGFKDLPDLDCDLCFLVAVGKLTKVLGDSADAYDGFNHDLGADGFAYLLSKLADLLAVHSKLKLLDNNDVGFAHAENEVLLLVREHTLNQLKRCYVGFIKLTDKQHGAGNIRYKVKLLRADIYVTWQYVIRDDVFDESYLVVFFVVIRLSLVKGNRGHNADAARGGVSAVYKYRVIEAGIGAAENFIGTRR